MKTRTRRSRDIESAATDETPGAALATATGQPVETPRSAGKEPDGAAGIISVAAAAPSALIDEPELLAAEDALASIRDEWRTDTLVTEVRRAALAAVAHRRFAEERDAAAQRLARALAAQPV